MIKGKMTTKAYSKDLRVRVIEYLTSGHSYKECSLRFKVSISAIGRWYRSYKKDGTYESKCRGGSKKRIDLKGLKEYALNNPDLKLHPTSKLFKVSIFTISYWLKELGFSYKKKPSPMWKPMKEQERNIQRK